MYHDRKWAVSTFRELYATFAPKKFNPDGPEIAEKLMTTRAAHKMSAGAILGPLSDGDAHMLLPEDGDPDARVLTRVGQPPAVVRAVPAEAWVTA